MLTLKLSFCSLSGSVGMAFMISLEFLHLYLMLGIDYDYFKICNFQYQCHASKDQEDFAASAFETGKSTFQVNFYCVRKIL